MPQPSAAERGRQDEPVLEGNRHPDNGRLTECILMSKNIIGVFLRANIKVSVPVTLIAILLKCLTFYPPSDIIYDEILKLL